jgi:hypothetical protein
MGEHAEIRDYNATHRSQMAEPYTRVLAADASPLDTYIDLTGRKKDLERDLNAVKAQLVPVAEQLKQEFSHRGVRSERHAATGKLVYLTRKIWARARSEGETVTSAERAAAAAAMAADPDLSAFVEPGFNVNSLSAYFRDLAKERAETGAPVMNLSDLVPEHLRDVLALTEDYTLSVRS